MNKRETPRAVRDLARATRAVAAVCYELARMRSPEAYLFAAEVRRAYMEVRPSLLEMVRK